MLKSVKWEGKGKKPQLLLDSSSAESEESEEELAKDANADDAENGRNQKNKRKQFSINSDYAKKYDNWRNLEEMQRLKDRLGVTNISELNESSSSESSSEEDEDWSPEKEKAFLKTLACLKKKDPKIYDEQFGYFINEDETAGGGENNPSAGIGKGTKTASKERKPFTVRDHERVMILKKGGQLSDDENEEGSNKQPMSYPEELASIKTEFSKVLNDSDSSDDEGGDSLLGSKLLKKRAPKSKEDEQKDKEEYKLWLKGELDKVDKGKISKEDVKELKSLREYWTDDKLDDGEKFLRDYILNKKYIEPLEGGDDDYIPSYNEVVHDDEELSEDEKFESEREEFEHKYNFRFEEPDQEFIKRYPRTIKDSLRREEHKRKEHRDKAKERKEDAKSKRREEVQRLKALKRREIMDKIQKLHEITGNPDLELDEADIDGDFDPEEYDRRMQKLFNDDYYNEGDDIQKPVFEYDEEIDDEVNWEEWVPPHETNESAEDESANDDETVEPIKIKKKDTKRSTQEELIEASKGKRGRKKRSAFLDALEREKPKFDPKIHKSFEKYFDEYYKLDFEDLVGNLPCRFKYHKTTANDFGLSVDEILRAQDKELNQWASLKKTFQYREENEEEYEVKAYKKKAEREDLKKRILPSAFQNPSGSKVNSDDDDDAEEPNEPQKRKKKKKNKKKNRKQSDTPPESENVSNTNSTTPAPEESVQSPEREVKVDKKVANKKVKIDNGMSTETVSESHPEQSSPNKLSKRQRKNMKKKMAGGLSNNDQSNPGGTQHKEPSRSLNDPSVSKKSKKSEGGKPTKRKASETNDDNRVCVDDERLKAYGINPTKFKKRLKYGKS